MFMPSARDSDLTRLNTQIKSSVFDQLKEESRHRSARAGGHIGIGPIASEAIQFYFANRNKPSSTRKKTTSDRGAKFSAA
jgi:hypothetical protein